MPVHAGVPRRPHQHIVFPGSSGIRVFGRLFNNGLGSRERRKDGERERVTERESEGEGERARERERARTGEVANDAVGLLNRRDQRPAQQRDVLVVPAEVSLVSPPNGFN